MEVENSNKRGRSEEEELPEGSSSGVPTKRGKYADGRVTQKMKTTWYEQHQRTLNGMHQKISKCCDEEITASDYPVQWLGTTKSTMASTHEITWDKSGLNTAGEYIWVSGMMDDQIARISTTDPHKQQFFFFPKHQRPHTLRFDKKGGLWVGLEYTSKIVKLNLDKLLAGERGEEGINFAQHGPYEINEEEDYLAVLEVGLDAKPKPIQTHPHGFCFDRSQEHIWFTGKLTNTVGRVMIQEPHTVEHFEIPSVGAIPIYLALGPDDNIWGTCLANNKIIRVTTTDTHPTLVTEISITPKASLNRRPIVIEPDPAGKYMWFTTEAGHTLARIDPKKLQDVMDNHPDSDKKNHLLSCSCTSFFDATNPVLNIVEEFFVPMTQRNMLLGGFGFDAKGNIWVQSYVPKDSEPDGPDFLIKVDKSIRDAGVSVRQSSKIVGWGNITNVPMVYMELPRKEQREGDAVKRCPKILHRMIQGPDKNMWFTALGADRVGVVKVKGMAG